MSWDIRQGDVLDCLREMPDESVHCVVTSPPYWGLRDYGVPQQLGLEPTPEQYVAKMVEVFREVRRVLRSDGTCWLNMGDSYAGSWGAQSRPDGKPMPLVEGGDMLSARQIEAHPRGTHTGSLKNTPGLKPKDLVGIPWRVAFALQADGWYLRSDIIWAKPNPMPESVTDRPTKAHEYVFLLTKSARYFYDAEAIAEESETRDERRPYAPGVVDSRGNGHERGGGDQRESDTTRRNKRTVWTITTKPYPEAHFATFPPELPETCIKAGTSEKGCCAECGAPWERVVEHGRVTSTGGGPGREASGACLVGNRGDSNVGEFVAREHITTGWRPTCECWPPLHDDIPDPVRCTVLDPFAGSGTTLMVALRLGRDAIGIELSPEYVKLAENRIDEDCPLFNRATL